MYTYILFIYYIHIYIIDCTKNTNCTNEAINIALRRAATDMYLLSLVDSHVISKRSGFGVIAGYICIYIYILCM
jgi:hypothetical protein